MDTMICIGPSPGLISTARILMKERTTKRLKRAVDAYIYIFERIITAGLKSKWLFEPTMPQMTWAPRRDQAAT